MASDDQIKFELDLDASGFKEGIEGAKLALENMAKSSKSLEGVVDSLKSMAVVAGTVYGAFKVLQGIVNTVFEAENIKAVNQQFDVLAKNAGVAGDALKDGLVAASGGLIDDTDLLKIANNAIVAMGESAKKLPQIMDLARKATAAMGGDLQQNFEAITHAVSTGNTRMLRQLNIIVDNDKAFRNYALAIGKSIDQLTPAEQKQATLNAVLEKGNTAFKGIDDTVRSGQNTWKQTQVAIGQIGEALTLTFEKTFGDLVRKYLSGIKDIAVDTKKFLEYLYGTEDKQSKIERVSNELMQYKARIIDLERGEVGAWDILLGKDRSAEIKKAQAMVVGLEAELNGLKVKASEPVKETKKEVPKEIDYKALEARTKFESDYLKFQQQNLEFAQQTATTKEQFDNLEFSRKATMEAQRDAEFRNLQARQQAGLVDASNYELQKEQIELQFAQRREEMRRTEEERRLQVYQNEVRMAQSTAGGIAAAFKQGSAQAAADLGNFGKQGQRVFQSFSNHATSALQAWGAGEKTASEAAKGFLFGMLADEAEARGKLMMLASLFPPNPVGLGAGAGLIALSGFLRAQAGGSSKGVGGGGMVGGGGGDIGGYAGAAPSLDVASKQETKKAITIQIQGNYFETEQTRNRLMDMVREATDYTDYKYVQIGGK